MARRWTWMALAVLAVGIVWVARTRSQSQEAEVTTAHDLTYTRVGDRELKLDLARPSRGEGPFPAVLVIHGGGWREGNKAGNRALLDRFARHGYVAVSPQYRFSPKDPFPAQVQDVKAAVRWLRAHAEAYHVDADHIGAMGFSAGGHLSLMLGVTGPDDELEGDVAQDAPSSRVQAVVNFFGPTDLNAADIPPVTDDILKDFLGRVPAEDRTKAAKASPITYVTRDDPPVLTFQGTKDSLVPHTQAVKLADAQTAAGVPGRVELLLGAGHGWGEPDLVRTLAESLAFFDRYLKPRR